MDRGLENKRTCAYCENEFERNDMLFTKDCRGIPYRLVCYNCYDILMSEGYDGQYYDERDECFDDY